MFSERFQDIYFQKDAIEESKYIFLEGNQLKNRFKNCKSFSICELGFGTGLNFLLTSQLFLKENQKGILYYFSVEKYPLSIYDIKNALKNFKEIEIELEQLIFLLKQIYYPTIGFQTIYFHPRIRLTLLLGDVLEMLKKIYHSYFDCWFLDGFSPSKNPEMWQKEVFLEMARLSYKGSTFATFSTARIVKDGLKEANFYIQKKKGFGKKREMLFGYYLGGNQITIKKIHKIAVIGAGISGVSTAFFLLKRGYEVHLFDKNQGFMQEASGIPIALVYPYFSLSRNYLSDLTIQSYNFLISLLNSIQFFNDDEILKKWIFIYKSKNLEKLEDAKKIYFLDKLSIRKYKEGYFLRGIVLSQIKLKEILKNLLYSFNNFYFYPLTEIIEFLEEDQIYIMDKKATVYKFDAIVFCNSHYISNFFHYLDLQLVRGQLIEFSKEFFNKKLRNIVAEISILNKENKIYLGSSFEHFKAHLFRDPQSDIYILKKLKENCYQIFEQIANENFEFKIPTSAFIGLRAQSKDYLPIIGNLMDVKEYIKYLTSLFPNRKYKYLEIPLFNKSNIFLNLAHGTRGYNTSFFGGEIVSSLIDQVPLPIEKELFYFLLPERFIFRKWRSSGNRKEFQL